MYQWTKRKIQAKYNKVRENTQNYLQEVVKEEKNPHEIGLGFAIGTFIGILPTPGVSVLLGLLAAFIWKRLNKLAILAGIAVFNPVVNAPIIYFSHRLGGFLIPPVFPPDTPYGYLVKILHTSARILAGTIIVGALISIASYFIAKRIAEDYSIKKNARKI